MFDLNTLNVDKIKKQAAAKERAEKNLHKSKQEKFLNNQYRIVNLCAKEIGDIISGNSMFEIMDKVFSLSYASDLNIHFLLIYKTAVMKNKDNILEWNDEYLDNLDSMIVKCVQRDYVQDMEEIMDFLRARDNFFYFDFN